MFRSGDIKYLILKLWDVWLRNCLLVRMEALEYKTKLGQLVMVNPNKDGEDYHIFVKNEYQGNVIKHNGHWVGDLEEHSALTIDEVKILGTIIEQKLGKPM